MNSRRKMKARGRIWLIVSASVLVFGGVIALAIEGRSPGDGGKGNGKIAGPVSSQPEKALVPIGNDEVRRLELPRASVPDASEHIASWELFVEFVGSREDEKDPFELTLVSSFSGGKGVRVEARGDVLLDLKASKFGSLAKGQSLQVDVEHPNYMNATANLLIPEGWCLQDEPPRLSMRVHLTPVVGVVRGFMEMRDGAELCAGIFQLQGGVPVGELIDRQLLSKEGAFELQTPDGGDFVLAILVAEEDSGFAQRPFSRSVRLNKGVPLDLGRLHLETGLSLEGRVLFGSGIPDFQGVLLAEPLHSEGARFYNRRLVWLANRFEWARVVSAWDKTGQFGLFGLAATPYRIASNGWQASTYHAHPILQAYSEALTLIELLPPMSDLLLDLDEFAIEINVVGNGLAVEGAQVAIAFDSLGENGTKIESKSGVKSDISGRVTVLADAENDLTLVVSHKLYRDVMSVELDPQSMTNGQQITVELSELRDTGTLEIRPYSDLLRVLDDVVVDFKIFDKNKMDYAAIDMWLSASSSFAGNNGSLLTFPVQSERWGELNLSPEGYFLLSHIEPGDYLVQALPRSRKRNGACGVLPSQFEVRISAANKIVLQWTLEIGGRVRLNVHGAKGREFVSIASHEGAELRLNYAWTDAKSGAQSSSGRPFLYGLSEVSPALRAGHYWIQILTPNGSSRQSFEVMSGRVTDVDVDLSDR